jgi:Fur family transcriptional regulator, peroxide stress response regulator
MSVIHSIPRQTKYCHSIESLLNALGHATNAEILNVMRHTYPSLSATTVHRATARLASRGIIATAPIDKDGSMRYDSNTKPHDHFQCSVCGKLYDTDLKDKIIPILESSINNCSVSGQLLINGECKQCALVRFLSKHDDIVNLSG